MAIYGDLRDLKERHESHCFGVIWGTSDKITTN